MAKAPKKVSKKSVKKGATKKASPKKATTKQAPAKSADDNSAYPIGPVDLAERLNVQETTVRLKLRNHGADWGVEKRGGRWRFNEKEAKSIEKQWRSTAKETAGAE